MFLLQLYLHLFDHLKKNQEEIYPYLHEQGNRIASEINEFCTSNNIPAQMMNAGSMMHLIFSGEEIQSSRDISHSLYKVEKEFYLHLLGHNVIVPGIHLAFISYAHKPEIVGKKWLSSIQMFLHFPQIWDQQCLVESFIFLLLRISTIEWVFRKVL